MNKNRKKIVFMICATIIIGWVGFGVFAPMFSDMLKRASAQNEGEMEENVVVSEIVDSEENTTTEISSETLTIDDTIYAVSAGAESDGNYISFSTVNSVDDLNEEKKYKIESDADWIKLHAFSTQSSLGGMTFVLYYPEGVNTNQPWVLNSEKIGAGLGTGFAGLSAAAVISPMLITFLGFNAYEAIGIALASDVLASAVSAYTYGKSKNIDIKNGIVMLISVLLFTLLGSFVASHIPNSVMGNFSKFMTLLVGLKFL